LVDDNAHGAVGGMGTDVDDAAGEAVVAHAGHRDQHLSVEKAAFVALSAAFALAAAARASSGLRLVGFAAGCRLAVVILACPATEFHGESLLHCLPIANDRDLQEAACGSLTSLRHNRRKLQRFQCIYVFHVSPARAVRRTGLHNEFSGTDLVS